MIVRNAEIKLKSLAKTFKAIAVIGPRQSGKTTLVKTVFKGKPYVSLENPDIRNFAQNDPRGFLDSYKDGGVFDEIQRVPELFSYLQEMLDDTKKKGVFILSGSNNFLLQEAISQTLAGRIGYLNLLPFSLEELNSIKKLPKTDDELMFKGFYPPVYDQKIPVVDWSQNYIKTYIERDVRQIKNISDLLVFERFLSLLAGRCGQELNMNALSTEAGVDVKTIQSWIGILESSFIIYLLKSHHKNFNKTIVKRPKLYFYDTSIVCSLLRITTISHIVSHPLRGAIFENMVITELIKKRTNLGLPINLYYWRDKTGHEVDVIIDSASTLYPIEIKSGKTVNSDFFKNLEYWNKLSGEKKSLLLYSGSQSEKRSSGTEVKNWRSIMGLKI
jgi:predicted AAA+ superfamily ATPase